MGLLDETGLLKGETLRGDYARDRAVENQWVAVDGAIKAFAGTYPIEWAAFVKDQTQLKNDPNKYHESKNEAGKKSKTATRLSAAFPIAQNGDSLLEMLEKIIPGLTHKSSRDFILLLQKYPIFSPSKSITAEVHK